MSSKGKSKGRGKGKAVTVPRVIPVAQEQHEQEEEEEMHAKQGDDPASDVIFEDVPEGKEDQDGEEEGEEEEGVPLKKRKKKTPELTADQEQALVEWFTDQAVFFDQSLKDFKNKQKKDRILEEKAKEFGLTGEELGIWFKSQRTIYGRLSKKKSGQARKPTTIRQKWVMDNFSFLKSHIVVKSESRHLGKIIPPSVSEEEDEAEEEIVYQSKRTNKPSVDTDNPGTSSRSQPQPKGSQARKGRQADQRIDDALLSLVQKVSGTQAMAQQVDAALSASNNPRAAWAQWIGEELKDLPDNLWNQYQKESFTMVMKFKEAAQGLRVPPQQQIHQSPYQLPPRPAPVALSRMAPFGQPQPIIQLPPRPATTPLVSTPSYAPVGTPHMTMNFSSLAADGQGNFSFQLPADSQPFTSGEPSTSSQVVRITQVTQRDGGDEESCNIEAGTQ